MDRRTALRGFLWLVLVAVLAVVGVVALERSRTEARRPAPQVVAYLPGFVLSNRDGRDVRLDDLAGVVWIADFIYTRCPGPCPLMTQRLAEIGPRLPKGVLRVSITVDPEHDTPTVLDEYARRFGAGDDWLFLTGDRQAIWELSISGFKLGVAPAGVDSPPEQGPVIHATRLILVDGDGGLRGFYNPFEPADLDRLVRDARAVQREGNSPEP